MPNQRVILKYVLFGEDWTEQFYLGKDNTANAMAAIDPGFLQAAVSWRVPATYIASIRVSDVSQPRGFILRTPKQPAPPAANAEADSRKVAVLYRLRDASSLISRPIYLRGVRDDDVTRDLVTGADSLIGTAADGIPVYIAQLNRIGAQIRALTQIVPGDPILDWYDIKQLDVDAGGRVTFTTLSGLVPLLLGNRIILSRFDAKRFPGLNGHYTALNVQAPTFQVNYHSDLPAGTYFVTGPRYRQEQYRYLGIDLVDPQGKSTFRSFTARNTRFGPFGGRGRKRATVRRSQ